MRIKQLNALMRFLPLLLCSLLWFVRPAIVHAATDDIRVLIDVSGSMISTDPHNLRAPAMRMLTGLIPSGSTAGVWTFGRYVTMVVKLDQVDDGWRKLADKGAAGIHSRSQFTNIESALEQASRGWGKASADSNRNIILLTDGKVDISKQADKNVRSREELLNTRIPDLVRKGAKVHAIALSTSSDEALLRRLAVETAGSFEIAHNAGDLQRIFLRMFERAAKPDTVPLEGNEFSIDSSISEMTLLVFRKTDKKIKLIQPDSRVHSQVSHAEFVAWRDDQGYALITVKKPKPGRWKLDADVDNDNRVMIVTDLKLKVDELPAYASPDETLRFSVELHDNDKRISKNSFLKFVDFRLDHEFEGQNTVLPLALKESRDIADKGIYQHSIEAPLNEGLHQFVVSADARTFDRARRFSVEVQWPVQVKIDETEEPGQYRLLVTPRDAFIKPDSLRLAVNVKRPDGNEAPLPMLLQGSDWSGVVMADQIEGTHTLIIDFQAETQGGQKISKKMPGFSVEGQLKPVNASAVNAEAVDGEVAESGEGNTGHNAEEDDSALFMNLIVIGMTNVVLLLAGGAAFIFMRKRKLSNEVSLMEEDGDDND